MAEKDLLPNMLGSATAGIISRIFTHPLDTIKAKLQAPPGPSSELRPFRGPLDTFTKTFRTEGIKGFYRGFGAILVGGTPGTIIYLCSYDIVKTKLSNNFFTPKNDTSTSKNGEFLVHFTAGMLAETIACLVYVPVDVIKERLQVQQLANANNLKSPPSNYYNGSRDAFKKIMRVEGLGGIYKGYGATLASFGPFSALYFVFYEQFKQEAIKRKPSTDENEIDLPFNQLLLCSAGAGALASWLTSPLDMAKLRLQVQRGATSIQNSNGTIAMNERTAYKGMIDCMRKSYLHGGVSGLFRGAGARVIHFTPAMAITMTFHEKCRNFYASQLS